MQGLQHLGGFLRSQLGLASGVGMAAVAQGLWALLVIALHGGVHRVVGWAISRAPNPLWAW